MSDPIETRPVPPATEPPPEMETRKSASPLLWILLLIALIAVGWYFYNQRAGSAATADMNAPTPTSDAMTPTSSDSVEKTPRAASKPEKKKVVAKAEPASREVALLGNPKPDYPPEAYRAREEGTVVVAAKIDAEGNPGDVEISKRSGSRTLDRAAMDAVRKWKFSPAMQNGKTVASTIQVPVDFRLDDNR